MKLFYKYCFVAAVVLAIPSCKKNSGMESSLPAGDQPLHVTASSSAVRSVFTDANDGTLKWTGTETIGLYSVNLNQMNSGGLDADDPDDVMDFLNNQVLFSGLGTVSPLSSDPTQANIFTTIAAKDWVGGESGSNDDEYAFIAYYPASVPMSTFHEEISDNKIVNPLGFTFNINPSQDGVSYWDHQVLFDWGLKVTSVEVPDGEGHTTTVDKWEPTDASELYTRLGIINGATVNLDGFTPVSSMIRFNMRSFDLKDYSVKKLVISTGEGGLPITGAAGFFPLVGISGLYTVDHLFRGTDMPYVCANAYTDLTIDFSTAVPVGGTAGDNFYAVIIPSYKDVVLTFTAYDASDKAILSVVKNSPAGGFQPGICYSVALNLRSPYEIGGGYAGEYQAEEW